MVRTLLLFVLLLHLTGCSCGNPVGTGNGGGAGGAGAGGAGAGGGGGGTGNGGGGDAGACIDGLASLALAPQDTQLTIGATAADITFQAQGSVGGAPIDLTSRLQWTATRDDDTPPGSFPAAGRYAPTPGAGGVVTITATDGCVTASTRLTLRLETVLQDPGPGTTTRFNGTIVTNDASKTPHLVYPSDQTRFPRNIYKVLFQWRRGGHDFFRVTFDGPRSKTTVYTDGRHPTCAGQLTTAGCWEADSTAWLAIAGSNAGEVTSVTVEGVSMGDARVFQAPPITIGFSRRDVKGAIFYWSTTAAGVRRASVSDAAPEGYVVGKPVGTALPNAAGTVRCVACHTVSRSGKRMYAYTEATVKGGFVYEVTLQPPPVPLVTTQITTRKGFGTFRPDDLRVVATVDRKLAEFEADTGQKIVDLPVPEGTNPDWSPAGHELAYSDKGGDSPQGANLSLIGYAGGAWSDARVLVPAAGQSNLFPSFSPDGHHVAYARGRGGHGDRTLQLFVVSVDGGVPVELINANRVVNSQLTNGQHENNMPTWAPPGDFEWVAFNSVRPYGVVYPTGGTQQIWVAAIDRGRLAQGIDPSYPAFRFAFQDLAENNHRAFWTLDVRDPPDGGTAACLPFGASCGPTAPCCPGSTCTPSVEFGSLCLLPDPDGGSCLPAGSACDQTSGMACCGFNVCDVVTDGGAECRNTIE